jgi:hypothetical protein
MTVSDEIQERTMRRMTEAVERQQAMTVRRDETNASYIKATETRGFLTREELDEREEFYGE